MTAVAELDKLIQILEAEIPANPNSAKNLRRRQRLQRDLAKYFRSLEDAFPYSKIASLYGRHVKESLGSEMRGFLDPLLFKFDDELAFSMNGHLAEMYVSGQAEMITYGKTKAGVPIAYEGPPPSKAVDWAEKRGAKLVTQMNEETQRRLAHTISKGIENKRGIPGLARDIRGTFADMTKYRSELIARTETANALSTASLDSMKDMGIDGKQWVTAGDDRVSDECLGNEAEGVIAADRAFSGGVDAPPQHPDCLLPGNRVEAPLTIAASRALYDGDAIELTTEYRHNISVTANHMILTPLGFVKAKYLCEGNYVIGSLDSQRIVASIDPNYDQSPATIEDIWHSLMMQQSMMRSCVPTAPEDFYGDAGSFDGDVDIVGPDSFLTSDTIDTLGFEHIAKHEFNGGSAKPFEFPSLRPLLPFANRVIPAPDSFVCAGGEGIAFGGRQSLHSQHIGLATRSRKNSSNQQAAADNRPAYVELSRQFQFRFPGLIAPEQIVKIRNFHYSGHVYDLQSIEQLYIANSIIVKNCRCSLAPSMMKR